MFSWSVALLPVGGPLRKLSKRSSLALDAIHAALAALTTFTTSDDVLRLIEEAHACERIVEAWSDTSPTPNEREKAMRRILALNVAVARLRRTAR